MFHNLLTLLIVTALLATSCSLSHLESGNAVSGGMVMRNRAAGLHSREEMAKTHKAAEEEDSKTEQFSHSHQNNRGAKLLDFSHLYNFQIRKNLRTQRRHHHHYRHHRHSMHSQQLMEKKKNSSSTIAISSANSISKAKLRGPNPAVHGAFHVDYSGPRTHPPRNN